MTVAGDVVYYDTWEWATEWITDDPADHADDGWVTDPPTIWTTHG